MALGASHDPFLVKQNDTRPRIRMYLKQGASGAVSAIDLTDATAVVFNMRLATNPNTVVVSRGAAEILTPATAGGVQYTFDASDTATVGQYQAEFEVTFSDGGVLTVPNGEDWIYITIGDDIA